MTSAPRTSGDVVITSGSSAIYLFLSTLPLSSRNRTYSAYKNARSSSFALSTGSGQFAAAMSSGVTREEYSSAIVS